MTNEALEAAITAWFGGRTPQPIDEQFMPRMKRAIEAYHRELDTHVLVPDPPAEKMWSEESIQQWAANHHRVK